MVTGAPRLIFQKNEEVTDLNFGGTPSTDQIFFNFMVFLGNFYKIYLRCHPPPPLCIPGSTAVDTN